MSAPVPAPTLRTLEFVGLSSRIKRIRKCRLSLIGASRLFRSSYCFASFSVKKSAGGVLIRELIPTFFDRKNPTRLGIALGNAIRRPMTVDYQQSRMAL